MKNSLILLLVMLIAGNLLAQGHLLLVGGGQEKGTENAWERAAYTHAVAQTNNKRVAIIYYSNSDDGWLSNYFTNSCGAQYAAFIPITTAAQANLQATYDTLTNYDMLFFKGGDQYEYYSRYKKTKTAMAIETVFNNGGVIGGTSAGMAILSQIVFTAQNGTVYPDECLDNVSNDYMSLADDFLNLMPNYIFDTHFAERGRMNRLIGFMANWYLNQSEAIRGIGIDDMTALFIDKENIATAYGTGAAQIYLSPQDGFKLQNNRLVFNNLKTIQLLQGTSINLNTLEISGFANQIDINLNSEQIAATIWATGSDQTAKTEAALSDFVNSGGDATTPIIVITGSDQQLANSYYTAIKAMGNPNCFVINATLENASNEEVTEKINKAAKFIFVGNNNASVVAFLEAGSSGQALKNAIFADNAYLFFAGKNAALPGKTIISNHEISGASYYAEMEFTPGINLLQNSVILPDMYANSDIFENTMTAVPYAMVSQSVKFGFWLTDNNYVKYTNNGTNTYFTAGGQNPVVAAEFTGNSSGVSTQTATGANTYPARQVAGFDSIAVHYLTETNKLISGTVKFVGIYDSQRNTSVDFHIFPNPAIDKITLKNTEMARFIKIYNTQGQLVKNIDQNLQEINVKNLTKGLYIISLYDKNKQIIATQKFLKK